MSIKVIIQKILGNAACTTSSVGALPKPVDFTDANLAAIEKKARAYYESISRGGIVPDSAMRTDLTDQAYLASVGCLDLLAEIRRLQALVARKGDAPDVT